MLCSIDVWSRSPLLRHQRDQARLLDPASSTGPNIAPNWTVAPPDPFPIIRYDAKAGERSLDVMPWGSRAVLGNGHQGRILEHNNQRARGHPRRAVIRHLPPT